jgi:hypothetical protein
MLEDRVGLDESTLARITGYVGNQKTLEDVVRDGLALTPARMVADIVTQDEYTHDVVLPFEGELYLVYDAT